MFDPSEVVNVLSLGIAAGSLNALLGVSFAVIYSPTRIFHLAHGATFLVASYLLYALISASGWPWWAALVAGAAGAAVVGMALEYVVYRPLRNRGASHLIVFIASASLLGLAQAVIAAVAGTSHQSLPFNVSTVSDSLSLTNVQVVTIVGSWAIIVPLAIWMRRSTWGKTIRAVGDSPEAAVRRGIRIPSVYLISFALGSALLAPAALLQGWAVGLSPEVGFQPALVGVATTLIAEGRGLLATAVVGLGLGVVEGLSLLFFPSGWQRGITFLVLFLVVVARGSFSKARTLAA